MFKPNKKLFFYNYLVFGFGTGKLDSSQMPLEEEKSLHESRTNAMLTFNKSAKAFLKDVKPDSKDKKVISAFNTKVKEKFENFEGQLSDKINKETDKSKMESAVNVALESLKEYIKQQLEYIRLREALKTGIDEKRQKTRDAILSYYQQLIDKGLVDKEKVSKDEVDTLTLNLLTSFENGNKKAVDSLSDESVKRLEGQLPKRIDEDCEEIQKIVYATIREWNKGDKKINREIYKNEKWESLGADQLPKIRDPKTGKFINLPPYESPMADKKYVDSVTKEKKEKEDLKAQFEGLINVRSLQREMVKSVLLAQFPELKDKGNDEMAAKIAELLPNAQNELNIAKNKTIWEKSTYPLKYLFKDWGVNERNKENLPLINAELNILNNTLRAISKGRQEVEKKNIDDIKDNATTIKKLNIQKVQGSNEIKISIFAEKDKKEIKWEQTIDFGKQEPLSVSMGLGSFSLDSAMQNMPEPALLLSKYIPVELYEKLKTTIQYDSILDELQPDVTVTGYASFDGDLNENKALALSRANAVVEKIKKKYPKMKLTINSIVLGPAGEVKTDDDLKKTWNEALKQLNLKLSDKQKIKDINELKAKVNEYDNNPAGLNETVKKYFDEWLKDKRKTDVKLMPTKQVIDKNFEKVS